MVLIATASAVVSLPLFPFLSGPAGRCVAVADRLGDHRTCRLFHRPRREAYRAGDMGQVYPIARGSAPLMTAIVGRRCSSARISASRLGRHPRCSSAVCFCCRCAAAATSHLDNRAVAFALLTAVTICGYSLVDGIGARASGSAHGWPAVAVRLRWPDDAVSYALWRGAGALSFRSSSDTGRWR